MSVADFMRKRWQWLHYGYMTKDGKTLNCLETDEIKYCT